MVGSSGASLRRVGRALDNKVCDCALTRVRGNKPVIAIPEKSIAVLPFENLSEEKANAFFALGIQDEILTRLAKIADLKVISRTSTAQYRASRRV